MSDSEFLPVWKKYPGVAGTMIKAIISMKNASHRIDVDHGETIDPSPCRLFRVHVESFPQISFFYPADMLKEDYRVHEEHEEQ